MPSPIAPQNRAVALELLEMAERGQYIPSWVLSFALHEDWRLFSSRRPTLAAIDLLIAAGETAQVLARLRRPPPPR